MQLPDDEANRDAPSVQYQGFCGMGLFGFVLLPVLHPHADGQGSRQSSSSGRRCHATRLPGSSGHGNALICVDLIIWGCARAW